jgi:hypothetical protein
MTTLGVFGIVFMCLAGSRLLDLWWPTKLLPAWFYAGELLVGIVIVLVAGTW